MTPDDMTVQVGRIVAALFGIKQAIEELPANFLNTPISSVSVSNWDLAAAPSTTPSPPEYVPREETFPSSEGRQVDPYCVDGLMFHGPAGFSAFTNDYGKIADRLNEQHRWLVKLANWNHVNARHGGLIDECGCNTCEQMRKLLGDLTYSD